MRQLRYYSEVGDFAKTACGPFSFMPGLGWHSTAVKVCGALVTVSADLVEVTAWGHLLITSCPENW